jgi:NAD(P)-dependent dehydrogenase (short-subunit alcohol dehydrogenase family)
MPIPTIYFTEKKINDILKFLEGPPSSIESTLSKAGKLRWATWSFHLTDNSVFRTFSPTKSKFLLLTRFSYGEVPESHHPQEVAKMEFSLKNKVLLITGASRGIGQAAAIGLAQAGADLAITSRSLPDLEKVAEEIKKTGRKCLPVPAHVGKMEEINNLVKRVLEEFGRIDILVNNAATNPTMAQAIDIEERAWDSIMNLNLKGLFFLSQAVAKVMRGKGGGKIINVASVAGITPDILPIYSISKAGVIMATKVMAQQWAQFNIRVNAIAPGLTKTRFSEALWKNPDILKMAMLKTPMGRPAEPVEMVGAIIYLASDASSYVTGQVIAIDGGNTI